MTSHPPDPSINASVNTRILPADPAAITSAAALIRAGQLVAFPTETVYGLGANALDSNAVASIFAAKGRPTSDPVIVHIARIEQISQLVTSLTGAALPLIEALWPGPLTLILPRRASVPANVSAGLNTIGVRIPSHPVALALLREAGVPIAAPSANRFAHTSPTTAQHVYADLNGRIPLILDGGPASVGVESTIVDVSSPRPRLLRPGGVPVEKLRRLVPDLEVTERYLHANSHEPMAAPGMLLKHYSPRASMTLFAGDDAPLRAALRQHTRQAAASGKRVGLLIADEDQPALRGLDALIVTLGACNDLDTVARQLFAGLRSLDEQGAEVILARAFPTHDLGHAIWDRMLRAAEGRVQYV